MREYVGVAFNTMLKVDDKGKLDARAEIILISSSPVWGADASGIRPSRVLDEHRVIAGAKSLRVLAKAFEEQAEELERVEEATKNVTIE